MCEVFWNRIFGSTTVFLQVIEHETEKCEIGKDSEVRALQRMLEAKHIQFTRNESHN